MKTNSGISKKGVLGGKIFWVDRLLRKNYSPFPQAFSLVYCLMDAWVMLFTVLRNKSRDFNKALENQE